MQHVSLTKLVISCIENPNLDNLSLIKRHIIIGY